MTTKIAVQKWFLREHGMSSEGIKMMMEKELIISRETEKAVLIKGYEMWIPKSCLIDEWETKKDAYDYHDYLVEVVKNEYDKGNLGEKQTISNGYNTYSRFAFIHQKSTKEIINILNKYNIKCLTKDEYIG